MSGETWCVYIVECSDNTYYCGIAKNLHKRIEKHNTGSGAKYTRSRYPVKLKYKLFVENRSIASKIEYKIKKYTRKQKQDLIKYNVFPEKIIDYKNNKFYMNNGKLYILAELYTTKKDIWLEYYNDELKKIYLNKIREKKLNIILDKKK